MRIHCGVLIITSALVAYEIGFSSQLTWAAQNDTVKTQSKAQSSCIPEVLSVELEQFSNRPPGFQSRERISLVQKLTRRPPSDDSIASSELRKSSKAPTGVLTPVEYARSRGSQGGRFYKDETGELYFLKPDLVHPELQTGAEVISAEIYRHFGYFAPETHIVKLNGKRYSASRVAPEGKDSTLQSDMPNTPQMRMMRIVAAFLQDWDRLRVGPNNRIFKDGSIGLFDFGGTLGARAQGEFKPGEVMSDAIGAFKAPSPVDTYGKKPSMVAVKQWPGDNPMKSLFDSFDIKWLPSSHPWQKVTDEDARLAREYFRTLDTDAITEIVDRAQYSSWFDRNEMISSLTVRRNAFMEYLDEYLSGKRNIDPSSYWAKFIPTPALSFKVGENRSPQIETDIRKFVEAHPVPSGQMLLFRGQETLTSKVLSRDAMERAKQGQEHLTDPEIKKHLDDLLYKSKMGLNWGRDEAAKNSLLSSTNNGEKTWWDRANPMDSLVDSHAYSGGNPFFVSATRDLRVASRWIENIRKPNRYRYVYILSVPETKTIPVTQSLIFKHGTNRESEIDVLYDASPYVIGVYDTVDLKFINLPQGQ